MAATVTNKSLPEHLCGFFFIFPFPLRILVPDVCLGLPCVFTLAKIIPFAEYLAEIVAGPVAGKDGWASRRAAVWAAVRLVRLLVRHGDDDRPSEVRVHL